MIKRFLVVREKLKDSVSICEYLFQFLVYSIGIFSKLSYRLEHETSKEFFFVIIGECAVKKCL